MRSSSGSITCRNAAACLNHPGWCGRCTWQGPASWRATMTPTRHTLPVQASPDGGSTPWSLTFDLRERETLWTQENKARLVAILARDQIGITQEELEDRMDLLLTLVPDLRNRIASLKPQLLAALLNSPLDHLADIIITLKDLFPTADIGAMCSMEPALLLQSRASLQHAAKQLREMLGTPHVDTLVAEQPLFLDSACVSEVIKELQVLMPTTDVKALLVADPSWLLRAQRGQKWLGQNPDQ